MKKGNFKIEDDTKDSYDNIIPAGLQHVSHDYLILSKKVTVLQRMYCIYLLSHYCRQIGVYTWWHTIQTYLCRRDHVSTFCIWYHPFVYHPKILWWKYIGPIFHRNPRFVMKSNRALSDKIGKTCLTFFLRYISMLKWVVFRIASLYI